MQQFHVWINRIQSAANRIAGAINALPSGRVLTTLIVIFAIWRAFTLNFIEKSGDAVWKWGFLRYYAATQQWYPLHPDHHQGRWGITMPVLGLIELLGDAYWVYYVYPLLMALGTGILLFLITRRLFSQTAASAAFLLCMLFPLTVRESTQFLPMLPAAFYVLLATWLLLNHLKNGALVPVFFSGILVGISYGCKFTSLFWGAAFLLFLSLHPSGKKCFFRIWKFHFGSAVVLFSLGLLLVLGTETVLLNHFFGTTFGRPEVILGSHLSNRPSPQYLNLPEYLLSFLRPLYIKGKYFDFLPRIMLLGLSLPFAIWLYRKGSKEQRLIAFSFLVVYLLHCYVVYKVFPFLHPERPHGRYFLLLAVFAMIIVTGCWKKAGEELKRRFSVHTVILAQILFIGVLLLMMLIKAGNQIKHGEHLFALLSTERKVAAARAETLPVLSRINDVEEFLAGKITETDYKYGDLWTKFLGPVELVPVYGERFFPYKDESGRLWLLLFPLPPSTASTPDGKVKCLLFDEMNSEIADKRLFPLPEEFQQQKKERIK